MTGTTGMLSIVATPIGNLQDITFRAIETLKNADLILAEDTRRTGLLLQHYSIKTPMLPFHEYNEKQRETDVIQRLLQGQRIALVSDAGTPLVSDPGFKLVRSCIENGIKVEPIPGPSAAITALTVSGLPPDKFLFIGFLPEKPGKRRRLLEALNPFCHSISVIPDLVGNLSPKKATADPRSPHSEAMGLREDDKPEDSDKSVLKTTIILYESPYHLLRTLKEMQEIFGDIPVVIARELTKIHEEIFRGSIAQALAHFKSPKGEFVILF